MFKPGNQVRCIDPGSSQKLLVYNNIYEVSYVDISGLVHLTSTGSGGWNCSRFELVEESITKKYRFRNPSRGVVIEKLYENHNAPKSQQTGWLVKRDTNCTTEVVFRDLNGATIVGRSSDIDIIEVSVFEIKEVGLYETDDGDKTHIYCKDGSRWLGVVQNQVSVCMYATDGSWVCKNHKDGHIPTSNSGNVVKFLGPLKM